MSAATCLSVVAEPTPYVLSRVFDVLARQGVMPIRCHTHLGAAAPSANRQELTIDLHFEGVDERLAAKLAHGMERIVEVGDVLIGAKCAA